MHGLEKRGRPCWMESCKHGVVLVREERPLERSVGWHGECTGVGHRVALGSLGRLATGDRELC